MKKVMFGILFLAVILISGCELMQEDPQLAAQIKAIGGGATRGGVSDSFCIDSDGGDFIQEYGYTQDDNLDTLHDRCALSYGLNDENRIVESCDGGMNPGIPKCYILESICDGNQMTYRKLGCEDGCYNGECKPGAAYQKVLDILNACEVTEIQGALTTNCDDYCADLGQTCVKEDYLYYVGDLGWIVTDTETDCKDTYSLNNTNAPGGEKLHCRCC